MLRAITRIKIMCRNMLSLGEAKRRRMRPNIESMLWRRKLSQPHPNSLLSPVLSSMWRLQYAQIRIQHQLHIVQAIARGESTNGLMKKGELKNRSRKIEKGNGNRNEPSVRLVLAGVYCTCSLRESSPIWVSEVSLARTRERGGRGPSRVLPRLASLAQIGELAHLPTRIGCN